MQVCQCPDVCLARQQRKYFNLWCVSGPAAVNCPLPKPPTGGKIVHDKAVTGTTVKYGHSWTYECNPPKAPSHERGSCWADGTATEPPRCQGTPPTYVLSSASLTAVVNKIPSAFVGPEVSCPIPTGIPNGFITFAVMRAHGYKEKVKYGCVDHYVLEGGAETQCQNTGNWSSKPVCRGGWRSAITLLSVLLASTSRCPTSGEGVSQLLCILPSLRSLFQLPARLLSKEAASLTIPRRSGSQI